MQQISSVSEQTGLRTRLTDPAAIAAATKLLREAGYTELAIWRHFIDAFAVDLDALSLVMAELFGTQRAELRPATSTALSSPRKEAARLRAA